MDNLQSAYITYSGQPNENNKEALWIAVYTFLHRRAKLQDNASDATTDIINAIDTYDPDIKPFETWVISVAANRRRKNYTSHFEIPTEASDLEQLVLDRPSTGGIKLDLACIKDPQTRMLCEDVLQGYTIGDASERCGLTQEAGYKRLQRLGKNISRDCLIL